MLPFICAESMWVARNYFHKKQIIFTVESVEYPWANKEYIALQDFVSSWGGDTYYEHNAELFWFQFHQKIFHKSEKEIQSIKFPEYIYTSKFNYDSLVAVKRIIKLSHNDSLTSESKQLLFRYCNQ